MGNKNNEIKTNDNACSCLIDDLISENLENNKNKKN